jgi:hypothetical protein
MRWLAIFALAGCATACGLDEHGLGAAAGVDAAVEGGPPGEAGEAGVGGGVDASAASSDGGPGSDAKSPTFDAGPCTAALPAGWALVASEASRAPCPAGYGGSHDEVAGATAGAGACACSCTITAQPSCDQGSLSTQWAGQPSPGICPNAASQLPVSGSACMGLTPMTQLQQAFSAEALPPTGGTCTGSVNPDPSKVTKNGVRTCVPPPSSAEALCNGLAPAGFAACLVASGDVACPPGPFAVRAVVSDDVELVCPTCGACAVGGTCTGAQISFYGDGQCASLVATLPCNGTCADTGGGPGGGARGVGSYKYAASPQATCQATPSGVATFQPVTPHTVCCR